MPLSWKRAVGEYDGAVEVALKWARGHEGGSAQFSFPSSEGLTNEEASGSIKVSEERCERCVRKGVDR